MNNGGNGVYNSNAVRQYMKNICLYAEHTGLTEEPNEICFLYRDNTKTRVLMKGMPILTGAAICRRFKVSSSQVSAVIRSGISLYDFAKVIEWQPFTRGGEVINSLEEFKARTVGDRFVNYLKQGKSIFALDSELYSGFETGRIRRLSDSEIDDFLPGKASISFDKYTGSSAKSRQFDFATVSVPLIGIADFTKEERIDMVRKHRKAIDEVAIDTVKSSKRFISAGVSINFIKCDSCTLMRDCQMVYKFSWKLENPVI